MSISIAQTISTVQSHAWDQIARERLGAEMSMSALLSVNPQARGVLLFFGERRVTLLAAAEKNARSAPPPWKKGAKP